MNWRRRRGRLFEKSRPRTPGKNFQCLWDGICRHAACLKNSTAAQAYLQGLWLADREIDALSAHRRDILDLACRVTAAPSETPGCRPSDRTGRVEACGVSLADYGGDIGRRISLLVERKREAMALLDRLPDSRMGLLLAMRYLNGWDWEVIMGKLGYERAQVFRLHRDALRELEKAMGAGRTAHSGNEIN